MLLTGLLFIASVSLPVHVNALGGPGYAFLVSALCMLAWYRFVPAGAGIAQGAIYLVVLGWQGLYTAMWLYRTVVYAVG